MRPLLTVHLSLLDYLLYDRPKGPTMLTLSAERPIETEYRRFHVWRGQQWLTESSVLPHLI